LKKQTIILVFTMLLTLNMFGLTINITANPGTIRVPADVKTIQEAINRASPGDTILVAAGTYFERIKVNKTVTLIGESAQTTIIDGNKQGIIVNITASNVQIMNFTIQNGGSYAGIWVEAPNAQNAAGVKIKGNVLSANYLGVLFSRCIFCEISENKFLKNQYAIRTTFSSFNTIQKNFINASIFYGMHLHSYSENNTIKFNTLLSNKYGILLDYSKNNYLFGNTIQAQTTQNGYGIRLTTTTNTTIVANIIETNYYGIVLWESSTSNIMYYNNFIENSVQAYHYNTPLTANTWDTNVCPEAKGNYWSDYKGLDNGSGTGRWGEPRVAGDGVGDTLTPHLSIDYYPLMYPWSLWPIARFTFYPDPPYPHETVTFNASTSSGDITSFTWNFGDSSTNYTEGDPIITHMYETSGNYTVTLTVTDREGLKNSTSKIVTVMPFRLKIDVYTQQVPYSGKGPNMPSDAFTPQELVILYANVTFNDSPAEGKIVNFEVYEPNATSPFISRTNITNADGIAWIDFRLNTTPPFGTYHVIANVEVVGNIAEDTLTFRVGWIIQILAVETLDKDGNPCVEFSKKDTIQFNLIVENIAFLSKNATLTMVIYDEKETSIGEADVQLKIDPGWSELRMIICLTIPEWSLVGSAQVFANAYTNWLNVGGVPYCPEKMAAIMIYP